MGTTLNTAEEIAGLLAEVTYALHVVITRPEFPKDHYEEIVARTRAFILLHYPSLAPRLYD